MGMHQEQFYLFSSENARDTTRYGVNQHNSASILPQEPDIVQTKEIVP